jgi:hypothetical protein
MENLISNFRSVLDYCTFNPQPETTDEKREVSKHELDNDLDENFHLVESDEKREVSSREISFDNFVMVDNKTYYDIDELDASTPTNLLNNKHFKINQKILKIVSQINEIMSLIYEWKKTADYSPENVANEANNAFINKIHLISENFAGKNLTLDYGNFERINFIRNDSLHNLKYFINSIYSLTYEISALHNKFKTTTNNTDLEEMNKDLSALYDNFLFVLNNREKSVIESLQTFTLIN